MTANQAIYPIEMMAKTLNVSRSGFNAWCGRSPSALSMADGDLTECIGKIHAASKQTYGAARIHAGCKRVERLMKAAG